MSGIKTEEEYFEILRNRIIECICRELLSNNLTPFHEVDLISGVLKPFLMSVELISMSLVENTNTIGMFWREYIDRWLNVDLSTNMKIITSKYLKDRGYVLFTEES